MFQQEVMHEETVALPEDVRNVSYEIGRPGCSWGQPGSRKEDLGFVKQIGSSSAQCCVSHAIAAYLAPWTAVTRAGSGSGAGDSLCADLGHGGNTGQAGSASWLQLQILYVKQGIIIIKSFRLIFKDTNVFQIRNIILH